jgi:hypothetical protein
MIRPELSIALQYSAYTWDLMWKELHLKSLDTIELDELQAANLRMPRTCKTILEVLLVLWLAGIFSQVWVSDVSLKVWSQNQQRQYHLQTC